MKVKRLTDGTEEVDVKLLDDGRACIHLLVPGGSIKLDQHPVLTHPNTPKDIAYSIKCRADQKTIQSQKRGTVRFVCLTTTEASAVTCPQCLGA